MTLFSIKKCALLISLSLLIVLVSIEAKAEPNTLTILNWSEYIDPKLVNKFEKKYNAKIKEIYFETDDSRDAMMSANNGKIYDLIMVNGAKLSPYIKRKWISPITEKQVNNIKHIDKKWLSLFPSAHGNAVPYFWGTMGIAYRSDLVKKPFTKWKQLFEPTDDIKGKILMARSARELIGIALKANGFSMNSTNESELEQAFDLIEKQKQHVKDYAYLTLTDKSSLVAGSVVAATSYNGDAIMLQEHHDKIVFSVPSEGTNLWVDYLTVSNSSKNKALAYKFLNFINQPKNAAQLAQYVYFATPNKSAEKYLPRDFKQDKSIYPDRKTLNNSEIFKPLPAKIMRKYNQFYSRLIN